MITAIPFRTGNHAAVDADAGRLGASAGPASRAPASLPLPSCLVSEPLRVLVVDDDERVAASVRRSLEYGGYAVTVAHDGPEALAAAHRDRPALVVLDVMLPGIDGHGVARALRADPSLDPMVLMLTARDATADRVGGLDAGADDYLVKPFEHDELLARVRALLRRRPPVVTTATAEPEPLAYADLQLDPLTREAWRGGAQLNLTSLEFDLLWHFMRRPRQVFTRQQLLDAVWGGGSVATSNVVDVYIGYIRVKLEMNGQSRLVHTIRGVGYALRDRP
jgi:two-component system, OmpR family, response regulator MprA